MTAVVPPVVTDPAALFPDLARLRDAAAGGALDTVLDALAARRDRDPDEHAELSAVLVRTDGLDAPLEQYVADHPGDREARTLWAHRTIASSGHAAAPGDVDLARVADAERWLLRLCAEDPTDPHPWTLRLATARLLGLGAVETRRRYARLAEVRPQHVAAQRWMLEGLGPRHGGSWEESLAFARRVASDAPDGSPVGALVVAAHLARWAEESGGGNPYYLARPEVVGEAESASDRWLAAAGPESIATIRPHTELAVALGLAGSRARAAAHFRALGPVVAPQPWQLATQHVERLLRLRESALEPPEDAEPGPERDQEPEDGEEP